MLKLLLSSLLLLPTMAGAAEPIDQRFSQTLYLQPYSKLRQKADSGDAQAQYDLAYLYYKADSDPSISGVNQSYALAAHWYGKAARQGHLSAQFNMAVLYLHGHGVERDATRAYAWLLLASSRGHMASAQLMEDLEDILNPQQLQSARQISTQLIATGPASNSEPES